MHNESLLNSLLLPRFSSFVMLCLGSSGIALQLTGRDTRKKINIHTLPKGQHIIINAKWKRQLLLALSAFLLPSLSRRGGEQGEAAENKMVEYAFFFAVTLFIILHIYEYRPANPHTWTESAQHCDGKGKECERLHPMISFARFHWNQFDIHPKPATCEREAPNFNCNMKKKNRKICLRILN